MSHLDELIAQLCPAGVPFRTLGDLGQTVSGLTGKSKADFSEGNARYVSYKNAFANPAADQGASDFVVVRSGEKQNQLRRGDVIFTGSSESLEDVGMSSVVMTGPVEPLYLNSFCFALRFHETSQFLPAFCKHLFRSVSIRKQIRLTASGVTRINVSKPRIMKVRIPVPPLEVQREIVRILDRFTELEAQLEAELEAELEARQHQYAHLRDSLVADSPESQTIPLGAVCDIFDGTHQTPRYMGEGVPFVSVENIRGLGNTKKYISLEDFDRLYKAKPRRGDLFMTRIGTIGWCSEIANDDPLAYYVTLALIRPNPSRVSTGYLKHLIESGPGVRELRKRTLVNAVPVKINLGDIGKLALPIPPLDTQVRIAEILDEFAAVTNELDARLAAELAARRKQYAYYRDKLLTFEELSA